MQQLQLLINSTISQYLKLGALCKLFWKSIRTNRTIQILAIQTKITWSAWERTPIPHCNSCNYHAKGCHLTITSECNKYYHPSLAMQQLETAITQIDNVIWQDGLVCFVQQGCALDPLPLPLWKPQQCPCCWMCPFHLCYLCALWTPQHCELLAEVILDMYTGINPAHINFKFNYLYCVPHSINGKYGFRPPDP